MARTSTTRTPGGAESLPVDDIAGVHWPYVKVGLGSIGGARDALDASDVADGSSGTGVQAEGNYLWDPGGGYWVKARAARNDGAGNPGSYPGAAPLLYDQPGAAYVPAQNVRQGDGVSGYQLLADGSYAYNEAGGTWDRQRNNSQIINLLPSAARTAFVVSPVQNNWNWRGVIIRFAHLSGGPPAFDFIVREETSWQITAWSGVSVGNVNFVVYPGATKGPTQPALQGLTEPCSLPLPRRWCVMVYPSNATSWTYAVDAYMIL